MVTGESKGAGLLPDRIITPAEQKSVSTDRIIADVSRAMDLTGIAGLVADVWGTNKRRDEGKEYIRYYKDAPASMANLYARRWTDSTMALARSDFLVRADTFLDALTLQKITGVVSGSAGAVQGYAVNVGNTLFGYQVLFDAVCDMPFKYGISIPAERYWKQKMRTGVIKPDDQFLMWKKGITSKSDVETAIKEQWGYTDEDITKILQHMDYDPASREILRIMQLTDAPISWARKKFKALGYNDEDLNYAISMVANQTVETERNALQSALINDRVWGNMSEATFKLKLADLALRTEEIDVLVSVANTKRSYNLINMQRDTQVYLYRKDQFNADELYRRLWEDVLIETDVANAITSLEAAKKGIEWTAPA